MLSEPWVGLLALAVLLLWPGLLIVRAPWPFVPFLSLSFWLVSWGWLTPDGPGRQRFLVVTLVFSALVSGLRLFKPLEASRPSWPTLLVVTAALGRMAPVFGWLAPPGLDASFGSSSALLLVWRDGLPASYLPLYPILGFGLGDAGLATLAADLSLVAGIAPFRGFLLATLASEGLLTLALYAHVRRFWPEAWAAWSAVSVTAVGLLSVARSEGPGGATLALGFAVAGASLILHAQGRSACVAAGALWAGGSVVSAPVVLTAALATAVVILAKRGRLGLRGLGLGFAVAGLVAAPLLWRTTGGGGWSVPGLLPSVLALFIVGGIPMTAGAWSWRKLSAWAIAGCGALTLAASLADWWLRSARVLVSADDLAAAAWLENHSRATDVVCAGDEAARAWIPALAGRAASPPRWPDSVRAGRLTPPLEACRFGWGPPGTLPPAFRQGAVAVTRAPAVTASDRP